MEGMLAVHYTAIYIMIPHPQVLLPHMTTCWCVRTARCTPTEDDKCICTCTQL